MKRSPINIGLVIHGPEIIDSGRINSVIRVLREIGSLYALIGGTMGRVAVKDSLLEDVVDTSKNMQTSVALNYLSNLDVLVLANCGKTNLTGEIFGQIVSSKVNRTVIQVERLGFSDGRVILWLGEDGYKAEVVNRVAARVSDELGLELTIRLKKEIETDDEGSFKSRRLHGAKVGEHVFISGIVVGQVADENVVIVSKDGRLVDIKGVQIKTHGYDKISDIDLKTAYIKSGELRRGQKNNFSNRARQSLLEKGKVAFVDHSANSVLEVIDKEIICVITIGDDTTNICEDILSRFGIPIIGITDGDIDGIYRGANKSRDSIVIQVCGTSDDIVGNALQNNRLFDSNEHTFEEVKNIILDFLKIKRIRFKIRE